jgi:hypothetical protein
MPRVRHVHKILLCKKRNSGATPTRIEFSPIGNKAKTVTIEVELSDREAYALAQFIKRLPPVAYANDL